MRSLRKMNVVVDVLLAEAVVARAAGAVAELQLRIAGVRPPADRALVVVELILLLPAGALLLPPDAGGLPAEVYHGVAGLAGPPVPKLHAKKDQVVQHGYQREQVQRELRDVLHDHVGKQPQIHQRQPLHLHRQDHEQQHLHVREQGGHREEHGHEQEIPGHADHLIPGDEVHQKAEENCEKPAQENVKIELNSAPILLQQCAHPIVKIKGQQSQKRVVIKADEQEGHQPPELAVEDGPGVKGEVREQCEVAQQNAQDPGQHAAAHQIADQVRDAEMGVLIGKALHQAHGVFHEITSMKVKSEKRRVKSGRGGGDTVASFLHSSVSYPFPAAKSIKFCKFAK